MKNEVKAAIDLLKAEKIPYVLFIKDEGAHVSGRLPDVIALQMMVLAMMKAAGIDVSEIVEAYRDADLISSKTVEMIDRIVKNEYNVQWSISKGGAKQ